MHAKYIRLTTVHQLSACCQDQLRKEHRGPMERRGPRASTGDRRIDFAGWEQADLKSMKFAVGGPVDLTKHLFFLSCYRQDVNGDN